MSEEQEIAAKIGELGEQIKAAKTEKKPKEEWEPILNEMLALKVSLHTYMAFLCCSVIYLPLWNGRRLSVDRCSDWDYTVDYRPYDIS